MENNEFQNAKIAFGDPRETDDQITGLFLCGYGHSVMPENVMCAKKLKVIEWWGKFNFIQIIAGWNLDTPYHPAESVILMDAFEEMIQEALGRSVKDEYFNKLKNMTALDIEKLFDGDWPLGNMTDLPKESK
jgi:hypothetical protein